MAEPQQRPRRFDAVIFDWGGTLTPWHTIDLLDCWTAVTADPQLASALHDAELALWTRSRDEHRSATIEDVLAAASCALDTEQRHRYYDWWDAHTVTDPAVVPLWQELRAQGYRIGVLSNTMWPREEHHRIFVRDGVHELFDAAVYSSEIAWTKPHEAAFRAALSSVGVTDPSRAIYVGDRLFDDIYGAQRAGMLAVHVPHSDIPASQTTGVFGVPDATIQQLGELVSVIEDWESGRVAIRGAIDLETPRSQPSG